MWRFDFFVAQPLGNKKKVGAPQLLNAVFFCEKGFQLEFLSGKLG